VSLALRKGLPSATSAHGANAGVWDPPPRDGLIPAVGDVRLLNDHQHLLEIVRTHEKNPVDELRRLYPPLLTTAHVAEMMHSTIGDVRDKVHRRELPALRWGQQYRFFRDEVIDALSRVEPDNDEETPDHPERDET